MRRQQVAQAKRDMSVNYFRGATMAVVCSFSECSFFGVVLMLDVPRVYSVVVYE